MGWKFGPLKGREGCGELFKYCPTIGPGEKLLDGLDLDNADLVVIAVSVTVRANLMQQSCSISPLSWGENVVRPTSKQWPHFESMLATMV